MNAIPMLNIRAWTIADALMTTFCQTGLPKVIRCDTASEFRGSLMKAVNECLRIQVKYAAPYYHERQGLVESWGVGVF